MDDFEELRRVLLSREQEQIRQLGDRLDDRAKRARDVSGVLPHALKLSRERGDELTRALQPAVEGSIKDSIEKRPHTFIDIFYPLIGPLVRRSIAESLRGLLQSLNQTLQHTFSWQGLKWRFEALRTGKSFAEVVLLRSLVYRVEQLFLIHRETSLALLHVSADSALEQDSDMVAGMLSAIQDFARDSFKVGDDAGLEEFRIGELQVWIVPGRHAFLAAVIRGNPRRELHTTLEEAIDSAHILHGAALAKFDGDASVFEPLRPELESCLRTQYKPREEGAGHARAWLALTAAAALLICGAVFALRSAGRWNDFLSQLSTEPGIAVTSAERNWLFPSRVTGLRDPLAAEPAKFARHSDLDPERIEFDWKAYLALDPTSVRRRFWQRFGAVEGAQVSVKDGTLEISGAVPFEWIERVRREGAQVAGVAAVIERQLRVTFDPALVLERFRAAFPLPEGATARVEDGTLSLSGKAPYEWVAPAREGAARLPGITAVSEKDLQVTFDPALVLRRFEDRFGLPDTVSAAIRERTLALAGEASHAWLARVRRGATEIAGITALDEKNLTDLDQRSFQQARSVIESAFVYFLSDKANFATEGFAALSRLPDEIRRCETAAKRMGVGLAIEVRGHADATGLSEKNIELSRQRAEAVHTFLVACGLEAAMFKPLALGAPSAAPDTTPDGKPVGEQFERRVAFRVIQQPVSARP